MGNFPGYFSMGISRYQCFAWGKRRLLLPMSPFMGNLIRFCQLLTRPTPPGLFSFFNNIFTLIRGKIYNEITEVEQSVARERSGMVLRAIG